MRPNSTHTQKRILSYWIIVGLFFNGFSIIVLEIIGTRILAPYFGATLYVWTALIVNTLLGLGVGYSIGGRLADKAPELNRWHILFAVSGVSFLFVAFLADPVLRLIAPLGIAWGPLISGILLFFFPLLIMGMITPFAVRLGTHAIERVGTQAGNYYAISTIGSLVGAICTSYFFLPKMNLFHIELLIFFILCSFSVVWFIKEKKIGNALFLVILAVVAVVFVQGKPDTGIIERTQTFYGDTSVAYLTNDIKCILVYGIPQSCFNPDLNGSAFPYTKIMARTLEQLNSPSRILVIGEGGGLLSHEILKTYDVLIDTVDIDGTIFDLAKNHFPIKDDDRITEIVADGRQFLRDSDMKYDAILIDTFSGSEPPIHLYTNEFYELARTHLTNDGVLSVNVVATSYEEGREPLYDIYRTIQNSFSDMYISPSSDLVSNDSKVVNYIVFARNTELEHIGRVFTPTIMDDAQVLTDQKTNLDHTSLRVSEELITLYSETVL